MGILPDSDKSSKVNEAEEAEELDGNLGRSADKQALMKTVMEHDNTDVDDGKFVNEMINQNLNSFQPDLMMSQLQQNFKNAKQLYGETLLREATGESAGSIERNIKIPEFQKQLKSKLSAKARDLEDKGLLSRQGEILDQGRALAALELYASELDKIEARGLAGEHHHKKEDMHGIRNDVRSYQRGDKFRDVSWKATLKKAARRGHSEITRADLTTSTRQAKGEIHMVYALDASGSMRGKKIALAKRAGVALAHKATNQNDKVGLLVFADEISQEVKPTTDFFVLLDALTEIQAKKQTDIGKTIEHALTLFPDKNVTRHLLLLTDAQTTVGDDPQKETKKAASRAASMGITISIVGIELDEEAVTFAQELTSMTKGKLYMVDKNSNIDAIVLRDYERYAK